MAPKPYLYAVQRTSGHEVVSATIEVAKVSDVSARRTDAGVVELVLKGEAVATSEQTVGADEDLQLHRWPADDKLSGPVSKVVPTLKQPEAASA